ncbi:dTDP-4-dehydrorhamnose reductase [Nonlabens agnitus]|uniref:dTDP-4-dehydrorhamnose reductase n=2 Tax=Nonlabens agnitus TaxID=870484 RepID=A0A2S9WWL9_9FLAO|nr:dTDP-4-dehydrorhamnose reductase [Nonlabens agnitus]
MIIGAGGMLGISMVHELAGFDVVALEKEDLDITCYSKVRQQLLKHQPEYIINCAAYTAVDLAEREPEKAHKINGSAVGMLASLAKQINATIIHFSTDYVFDGKATEPYKPTDPVNPINVYGQSKLLGEILIKRSGAKHYIFRISWLYAPHGKNFFKWVLENDLEEMKVVDTQTGCPTSALDVASFVKHVIENDPKKHGTYHFSNEGSMTWYAFAKAIIKQAGLNNKITKTNKFSTLAKRPDYSTLDYSLIKKVFNYESPKACTALSNVFTQYKMLSS